MPAGKLREERTLNHREENKRLLEDFLLSLEAGNRSPHTILAYRLGIEDFLDFTLGLSVAEITHREISEWLHFLNVRGVKSSTVSQRLYSLRSFFKYAQLDGVLKDSPARLIQNRRVSRPLPHWLTPQQIQQLLNAADNPRDRALVEFMWATGCRISEVVSARLENINWSSRSLKVLGKGQKERLVLFGKKTAASLEKYLGSQRSGPLFREDREEQSGSILNQGASWTVFWRENERREDGTIRRRLRGKVVGQVREYLKRGRKADATYLRAAEMREQGHKWKEIYASLYPGTKLLPEGKMRVRNAVGYHLKQNSHDKTEAGEANILDERAAVEKGQRLITSIRRRSRRKIDPPIDRDAPMDARSIRRIIRELGVKAGLGRVYPHMIRHSMATAMLDGGADLRAIQDLLGHTSITTTQIYTHCSAAHLRKEMEKAHPSWQEERNEKK